MGEPFTPEQEARIREIVRTIWFDIERELDAALMASLSRAGGATGVDQHQVTATRTPKTLHDGLGSSERLDRLLDNRSA